VKRGDLLRHLQEARLPPEAPRLWINPATGAIEAVPRHSEVSDILARRICRGLSVPEIGR